MHEHGCNGAPIFIRPVGSLSFKISVSTCTLFGQDPLCHCIIAPPLPCTTGILLPVPLSETSMYGTVCFSLHRKRWQNARRAPAFCSKSSNAPLGTRREGEAPGTTWSYAADYIANIPIRMMRLRRSPGTNFRRLVRSAKERTKTVRQGIRRWNSVAFSPLR